MIKWKRESGSTIELNDTPEMIAYAESQGWSKVVKKEIKKESHNGNSSKRNTRRS
jgi:hypothetical protein